MDLLRIFHPEKRQVLEQHDTLAHMVWNKEYVPEEGVSVTHKMA